MTENVTTNIRLPKQLHKALKLRAAEEDKSMAQVLREAAAQYIISAEATEGFGSGDVDGDTLWLIGVDPVDLGITDASVNFDDYLYGPLSQSAKAEIKE